MKYIIQKKPGKVSVRHHTRHLEDGNTNVIDHSRSRPTSKRGVRDNIGRIPLKDLTYPQAKKIFPFLNPNGNIDGDNKVNKKDCRPFDAMRQDDDLDYWTEQELNEAERRETSSALQQSENHFDMDEPIDASRKIREYNEAEEKMRSEDETFYANEAQHDEERAQEGEFKMQKEIERDNERKKEKEKEQEEFKNKLFYDKTNNRYIHGRDL
jgi:hypothetical protein